MVVGAEPRAAEAAGRSPDARFEDHDAVLDLLWSKLSGATRDRRSPWHTPAVATIGLDGGPEARVMVLRGADRDKRLLRLHSDNRAGKVAELAANPAVSILLYDPPARLQLRARGTGHFLTGGPEVEEAWRVTQPFSRRCYTAPVAPGTTASRPTSGLPPELESREPSLAESEAGRTQFGILLAELHSLEWLFLAHAGHRRGRLDWDGQRWDGRWLIP